MIEDVEIATRYARLQLKSNKISIVGDSDAATLAASASEVLPEVTLLPQPNSQKIRWAQIVNEKREAWPIQYLVPGAATFPQ